jgi:hypothetical protein
LGAYPSAPSVDFVPDLLTSFESPRSGNARPTPLSSDTAQQIESVWIVVPALNEQWSIQQVVSGLRRFLQSRRDFGGRTADGESGVFGCRYFKNNA